MSDNSIHTVVRGECLESIAEQYGFFWQSLWYLPGNSELNKLRRNPNILKAGDEVVIPPTRQKVESCLTDAVHQFKRRGVPSRFSVRLLSGGEARNSLRFTCDINGRITEGTTGADGGISIAIPPNACKGILLVSDGDQVEEYELTFGELDPVSEISGVQQRLKNLGYECEASGQLDQTTKNALAAFRLAHKLSESDEVDHHNAVCPRSGSRELKRVMTKPIAPLVLQGESPTLYKVTPEEQSSGGKAYTTPRLEIAGCKNRAGEGAFTADSALKVFVTECVYPGGNDEAIVDKWVYVTHGNQILAEANAISPDEWLVNYDVDPNAQPDDRPMKAKTKGFFQLPRIRPQIYGFFLSPVRLAPSGFSALLKHLKGRDSAIVTRPFSSAIGTVAVPDPWRWARDAHRLYYQPSLDHYQSWVFDPDNSAKLFIAGVLKGWMENGDPGNVGEKLKAGQPTDFIWAYQIEELVRRQAAEVAMAYVANCVQAPEHRIIELSAEEAGDDYSFAYLCHQFAAITARLAQCKPGQQLALDIVKDQDRLSAKHLFTDRRPRNFDFPEGRYAWLAALATFEQLAQPALNQAMQAAKGELGLRELTRKYLLRLGISTYLGEPIMAHTSLSPAWRKQYQGLTPKIRETLKRRVLVAGEELQKDLAQATTLLTAVPPKLERVHRAMESSLKWLTISVGTIVESLNLYIAIAELHKCKEGEKPDKIWSVVGASADAARQLFDVAELLVFKRVGKTLGKVAARRLELAAGFLGGPLGMISGACDMQDFLNKVQEDTSHRDYGQAGGHGIAAVGAGMVAIGGGMALAWAASAQFMGTSIAGGPPGMLIGAIGSVLIISGCVIAAWLTDSHFQEFAKFCCFRMDGSVDGVRFPWASGTIGYDNPVREAQVLRNLLSNFVVERLDGFIDNNTYLKIRPAYMPNGAQFDFWYSLKSNSADGAQLAERQFSVALDDGLKVVGADNAQIWIDQSQVECDSNKVVKSFVIVIPPAGYINGTHYFTTDQVKMALDLDGTGNECTPFEGYLLSLPPDSHSREYSSLDKSQWVDEHGRPVEL